MAVSPQVFMISSILAGIGVAGESIRAIILNETFEAERISSCIEHLT